MVLRSYAVSVMMGVLSMPVADFYAQEITWTAGADLSAPRIAPAAVECGGRIYVIGGQSAPYTSGEKTTFEYNLEQDTWIARTDMPTARFNLTVAAVNGKIYAIGGDEFNNSIERYDPETDIWSAMTPMPTHRQHLKCAVVDGKIYVIGGLENWKKVSGKNEMYDPEMDSWVEKAPMPTPRHHPGIAVLNGKIYVIGGDRDDGRSIWETSAIVEVYDPVSDSWETKASLPTVRFFPGTAVIDNMLFVLGGWTAGSKDDLVSAWVDIYDSESDIWSKSTSLPQEVAAAGVVSIDRKLYVIGGYRDNTFTPLAENVIGYVVPPPVQVTYIANTGFLITSFGKKILIDALFNYGYETFAVPTEEVQDWMQNSLEPFDDIDLVVATHNHKDHFNAGMVAAHLKSNLVGVFIAPKDVVSSLVVRDDYTEISDKVHEITPDSSAAIDTTVNGIDVKVIRIQHTGNPDVQNIGFIADLNGTRIFHSGDNCGSPLEEFENYRLNEDAIDIAFLNRGFFWGTDIPRIVSGMEYIEPERIVLMHFAEDDMQEEIEHANTVTEQYKDDFPPVTILSRSLESITIDQSEGATRMLGTSTPTKRRFLQ